MQYLWLLLLFSSFTGAVDHTDNNLKACFFIKLLKNPQQLCLAAGEEADWLHTPEWNDQVISITVPKGLQVTLYKNDLD